jgi:tyrosyl-tRNA synthetase
MVSIKQPHGFAALCADKLSPFKFYQYFLTSVTDGEVVRFLRMLTFLPLEVDPRLESC